MDLPTLFAELATAASLGLAAINVNDRAHSFSGQPKAVLRSAR
jgi:hypothetical protein